MAESKGSGSSGGIGFFGLLGIVFITLKLLGVVQWPWWIVLLPIYGPLTAGLVIAGGIFAITWWIFGNKGVTDLLRGLTK